MVNKWNQMGKIFKDFLALQKKQKILTLTIMNILFVYVLFYLTKYKIECILEDEVVSSSCSMVGKILGTDNPHRILALTWTREPEENTFSREPEPVSNACCAI